MILASQAGDAGSIPAGCIMAKSSGEFGRLAAQYDAFRPTYPKKVISIVYGAIHSKNPVILDLGCGTGISTRQLAREKSSVVGCDIDAKMLKVALQRAKGNISYKQGSAEKLPFADAAFDAVTTFIAFHWFMNRKAINEIKRVLKPKGALCVVQPRYLQVQKDFRIILERELRRKIPKKYKISTEIVPFLVKNGFRVKMQNVRSDAKYTLNKYVDLLKSYSLWNYVPEPRRKEIEKLLKAHFRLKLQDGYIRNIKNIEVIIVKKRFVKK